MRPAWTCFVGIILCIALNRTTEYFTGTEYSRSRAWSGAARPGTPPTSLKVSPSGTSRRSGPAWSCACDLRVGDDLLQHDGPVEPIFIAYGVAMCGIGMLT